MSGMSRLLGDETRAEVIRTALESNDIEGVFEPRELAALQYVRKLTESPAAVTEDDIRSLRGAGWEDGDILEINQVTAYFNYANRVALGQGINPDGDVLGFSSSEDLDDYRRR